MITSVTLELERPTAGILLGYVLGTAELPHDRKLVLTGSGSHLEVTIDGLSGRVKVDLQPVVDAAALLLTGTEEEL